jgi:hypothetical protein
METVPQTLSGSKTFPPETEWPAVFIANEELSDNQPFPFWNRPSEMRKILDARLTQLDHIDARIKELGNNSEDPKNIRELATKTAEKRAKTIEVCIIYAKQAVSYSLDPVNHTVQFVAWICLQLGVARSERVDWDGRCWGLVVRPDPAFLRELCEHHGWRKILAAFSEQQVKQSAVPPLPPELEDFLKEPKSEESRPAGTKVAYNILPIPPVEEDVRILTPVAELIVRIKDLIRDLRGDEEQLKPVGPGVGVRYYVDPNPPEIFFDPPPSVRTRLAKYANFSLAYKQIEEQSRKVAGLAGMLSGSPDADTAELYWLIRLRTESPHFHAAGSGGWINNFLEATIELLQHLDRIGTLRPAAVLEPQMPPADSRTGSLPVSRQIAPPAIVTPEPPDTSFVRAVPAQYAEVEPGFQPPAPPIVAAAPQDEAPRSMPGDGDDQATESRSRPGRPRFTPNLHPEVEQYLDGVSKEAGHRITIQDFCLVSGFGDDTTFKFWRQGHPRCAEAHAKRFEHTLRMPFDQFLARLAQKTSELP